LPCHPPVVAQLNNSASNCNLQATLLPAPSGSTIAIAKTDHELSQIGRLRYELFIERDAKTYRSADSERRLFLEPVDSSSLNFFGMIDGCCLTAVRFTRAADAVCDVQLVNILERSDISANLLQTTAVNSRFVVREQVRARLLFPNMFRYVYRRALCMGITHSVLAARPSIVPIFTRFGFVACSAAFFDETAGPLVPMKLDCLNRTHLVETASPLLAEHDEFAKHH
jgi:hypothetical protein